MRARAGGAEQGGVRPFGVSLLMAGHDTHGPQLYQIDPSGSYFAWKASAIGKNMTNAKTFLEKRYSEVGPLPWIPITSYCIRHSLIWMSMDIRADSLGWLHEEHASARLQHLCTYWDLHTDV